MGGRNEGLPLGLGAGTLGNLYKVVSDEHALDTVDAAWASGIRHFDTAPFYGFGLSERRVGDALRARPREDYVLSTKVGRLLSPIPTASDRHGFVSPMPFEPAFDYSYDGVMRSYEDSLQRLGLSRIDCLYMHDLGRLTHGDGHEAVMAEARGGLRALRDLKEQDAIGQYGLGVNEIAICDEVMAEGPLDRILLAGRYSLLNHEPLDGFFDRCRAAGTAITAAGVFNSGILATGVSGPGPHYYDYEEAPVEVMDRVRRIEAVCTAHGIPLAVAALRFVLAHPVVDDVLLGMSGEARVRRNAAMLNTDVPAAFWDEMRAESLLPAHAPT